jgi:hypothetical protein
MGTLTLQNIRDMTYKLLNEYQTVTANIDLNVVNRVDEQINMCYMELATKDKVSASFWISQFPIPNLLYPTSNQNNTNFDQNGYDGGMFITDSYLNTPLNYAAGSAGSYYFEVDSNCNVDIYEVSSVGTATLQTLSITGISIFTPYVGFITAAGSGDSLMLSFYTTGSTFNVRNVALYQYTFNGVTASIPSYVPWVVYDVPTDYYAINRMRYRYYNDYRTFSDYRIENGLANNWQVYIQRSYRGEFVFDYWRMPSAVTGDTQTFEIRDAYAYIIPWGAAGAIMLGNGFNAKVGTIMLQSYEQKKASIKLDHDFGYMKLDNVKGW